MSSTGLSTQFAKDCPDQARDCCPPKIVVCCPKTKDRRLCLHTGKMISVCQKCKPKKQKGCTQCCPKFHKKKCKKSCC